jgi:integrase-like protein
MFAILHVLWIFVVDIFKSRRRLEAENLFLRHQLNIALRRAPPRLRLYGSDRALLVWMTRIWPGLLDISRVVKPETILRWHRSGFKAFWRWKSRNRAGRPKVDRELRDLIRRDAAYGHVFTSRLRAMGIRDRPISPRSPWQNGYAERLIGTVRREFLDWMLIFGEAHLRRILSMYAIYYNESRTHLSLHKDAPLHRAIQRSGTVVAVPVLGGLHHRYARI